MLTVKLIKQEGLLVPGLPPVSLSQNGQFSSITTPQIGVLVLLQGYYPVSTSVTFSQWIASTLLYTLVNRDDGKKTFLSNKTTWCRDQALSTYIPIKSLTYKNKKKRLIDYNFTSKRKVTSSRKMTKKVNMKNLGTKQWFIEMSSLACLLQGICLFGVVATCYKHYK